MHRLGNQVHVGVEQGLTRKKAVDTVRGSRRRAEEGRGGVPLHWQNRPQEVVPGREKSVWSLRLRWVQMPVTGAHRLVFVSGGGVRGPGLPGPQLCTPWVAAPLSLDRPPPLGEKTGYLLFGFYSHDLI